MNCFVIMPFANEFDDVYASIKSTASEALHDDPIRCFRLDENRPAGRITNRLVEELRSAAFCVADLTGLRPNVMWEVGYAMALHKPTIIITQNKELLPFDLKDMQCIHYERAHLVSSLCGPLKGAIIDTIQFVIGTSPTQIAIQPAKEQSDFIGQLIGEVAELKNMMKQAVSLWKAPLNEHPKTEADFPGIEGPWVSRKNESHFYARLIKGEMIVPYCYTDNDELTAVYYGWKRAGEYWFGRFKWLVGDISGFAFIKIASADRITGAWWHDDFPREGLNMPSMGSGVELDWERQLGINTPKWAEEFFASVEKNGLDNALSTFRRPRARNFYR